MPVPTTAGLSHVLGLDRAPTERRRDVQHQLLVVDVEEPVAGEIVVEADLEGAADVAVHVQLLHGRPLGVCGIEERRVQAGANNRLNCWCGMR